MQALLLITLCTTGYVHAQVYEVRGGESSLYQANGGTLSVTSAGYNFELGAGIYAGHLETGARLERKVGDTTYIAGDDHLDFRLPTDVFDAAHYLYTRGLTVKRKFGETDMLLFGGVDTLTYSNPLFLGGKLGSGIGFLSLHRRINRKWQIFSDTVISNKQSQIVAIQWNPASKTELSFSAGVGSNEPYAAASFSTSRRWLDLKSSYVQAGRDFHRFVLNNPILSEPTKGNLIITISPTRRLSFNGGIQNYLVPLNNTGQNAASSSREIGASLHFLKANIAGALYESQYQGLVDHAGSATLQRPLTPRVQLLSTYMASRPQGNRGTSSFMTTITETFNARFSLSQSLETSGGSPTFYYGGTFQSNLISISANYETFYIPARTANPFENALMLDLTIRLFGRYRLHGQTNLSPTGHLLYTADAYGMAARGESAHRVTEDSTIGKSILRIRVIDTSGLAIEGAALMVDQSLIYTDSSGRLFVREHRPQAHKLTVLLDQFLSDGQYEVVSAPLTVQSTTKDDDPEIVIVLRRLVTVANHPVQHNNGQP